MKIEHLEERVQDYQASIKTVVDKRVLWNVEIKDRIKSTLNTIAEMYDIGWKVQELSWIQSNEAVNITFESFPAPLIDCTNLIPAYQFLSGGTLIFSQTYSGDVTVVMLFPELDNVPHEKAVKEFGIFRPSEITEKFIIEKVDEFLKSINQWEVPAKPKKVGY